MAGDGTFRPIARKDLPPRPPRRDIINGLLAEGEVMLLTGAPKAGKSVIAVQLAASVSTGRDFAGRGVRSGAVVYVALERFDLTIERMDAAEIDVAQTHLVPANKSLDLAKDGEPLATDLRGCNPRLVIIDTFAHAAPDLDENSARDMGRAIRGVRILQRELPSSAIVIVHHLDKAGTSSRGSGALLAAADIELRIGKKNDLRVAEVVAANAVPEGQRFAFAFEDHRGAVVARHCDLPAAGDKAHPTSSLSDQNAKTRADALERDLALLRILPDAFTKKDAVKRARDAELMHEKSSDTLRKNVERSIERLVRTGQLKQNGDTYFRLPKSDMPDGQTVSNRLPPSSSGPVSDSWTHADRRDRNSLNCPPDSRTAGTGPLYNRGLSVRASVQGEVPVQDDVEADHDA